MEPEDTDRETVDTTTQPDALTPPPSTESPETPATTDTAETAPDSAEEGESADEADTTEEPRVTDELDDETLSTLAEAYGDRLLATEQLREQVNRAVSKEVERQVRRTLREREVESQSGDLISVEQAAAQEINRIFSSARSELDKASKGEDFDAAVFNTESLAKHLGSYGSAAQSRAERQVDAAIEGAWDDVFSGDSLPVLSDDQAEELSGITETFNRMRGDPKQSERARSFLFSSLFKFVADRAIETGAVKERERVEKARSASEKIAGKNAIAAAKAKIEKERTPPATPKSSPTEPSVGNLSDEAYAKAKAAGDFAKAQAIVDARARRAFR